MVLWLWDTDFSQAVGIEMETMDFVLLNYFSYDTIEINSKYTVFFLSEKVDIPQTVIIIIDCLSKIKLYGMVLLGS